MQSLNLSHRPVYVNIVAVVCISIDCFPQNTVPTRLPFDCIGVRHPSIGTLAGSPIGFKQAGRLVFSFDFWSAGLAIHPLHGISEFCEWSEDWSGLCPRRSVPISSVMLGCPASIPRKTKQQIGTGFCSKRSTEMQTVATESDDIDRCL